MKEKDCAVEKKLSEKKSDMCLEVSLSINHYQYFGTSGFASFNFSASQERVVGFNAIFIWYFDTSTKSTQALSFQLNAWFDFFQSTLSYLARNRDKTCPSPRSLMTTSRRSSRFCNRMNSRNKYSAPQRGKIRSFFFFEIDFLEALLD